MRALPADVHRRFAFDQGRLAIVTPRPEHELFARTIDLIFRVWAERHGQPVESFGSATWKRPDRGRAVEADACYYVTNAPGIIGNSTIDLEVDPPPDIAVEVDVTGSSLDKLPIYEALGVPEVWRYDGATLRAVPSRRCSYVLKRPSSLSRQPTQPRSWFTTASALGSFECTNTTSVCSPCGRNSTVMSISPSVGFVSQNHV